MTTTTHSIEISQQMVNHKGLVKPHSKFSSYYELSKPGITKMVVFSTTVGYFLGLTSVSTHFSSLEGLIHFVLTVLGTTLVSAGSCALNHFVEREFDAKMARTENRPLVSGDLHPTQGLLFALALSIIGLYFVFLINSLTFTLAIVTTVTYIAVYTPLKRKTTFSTVIGALPGAIPALGGYTAVTNSFGVAGVLLFLVLFFWQLPHFYSLSWLYREDYANGGFVLDSVVDETGKSVSYKSAFYVVLLVATTVSFYLMYISSLFFLICSSLVGAYFLYQTIQFMRNRSKKMARTVLISSYIYLMSIFFLLLIDTLL
jgi:protoheme IX farnesyltransferase